VWTIESIADEFARAPEFVALYGQLSNRDFVERVYQNVLGRGTSTDPTGAAFWQGELDAGRRTRGQVLLAFSESAEYRSVRNNDNLVISLYNAMLQRAPSQSEFNSDSASLSNGSATTQGLIHRVIASAEYRGRFLP
jgi:hypothetical protein